VSKKPRLFVGSTKEGLELATTLRNLLGDSIDAKVWNEGIFNLSEPTMMSLVKALDNFDFAVFLFTPDNTVTIREKEFKTARDNIIYELGLFIGRLGLERTFFVIPDDCEDLRIPSDLHGITAATYSSALLKDDLKSTLTKAATEIGKAILVRWEKDIQIKEMADQTKGIISSESEKKYSEETFTRFMSIEERFKKLLIRDIISAENAHELPKKSELQNYSPYKLLDIHKSAKTSYDGGNAILIFLSAKISLDSRGEWDEWAQKAKDSELSNLERELDKWEGILTEPNET
jgi:hypothetical protein